MATVYKCICCSLEGRSPHPCSCVFAACYRCWRCRKCCRCPERLARECAFDPELDAPDGPFAGLSGHATDLPTQLPNG